MGKGRREKVLRHCFITYNYQRISLFAGYLLFLSGLLVRKIINLWQLW